MTEFAKMDIFFFVTTIAVVALSIVVFLLAIRVLRILAHVERIMEMAEQETELIKEDMDDFRRDIRRRGFSFLTLMRFLSGISSRFINSSRKEE